MSGMTLIERLHTIIGSLPVTLTIRRIIDDAIDAVAERDKLHADIETLRLDLDNMREQRDMSRKQWENNAAALVSTHASLAEQRKLTDALRSQRDKIFGENSHMRVLATVALEANEIRDDVRSCLTAIRDCGKGVDAKPTLNLDHELRSRDFKLGPVEFRDWDRQPLPNCRCVIPAPPSALTLVERLERLEREVLFVRQRPGSFRGPPRRP